MASLNCSWIKKLTQGYRLCNYGYDFAKTLIGFSDDILSGMAVQRNNSFCKMLFNPSLCFIKQLLNAHKIPNIFSIFLSDTI